MVNYFSPVNVSVLIVIIIISECISADWNEVKAPFFVDWYILITCAVYTH